jgi:hypothetical protein
MIACLSAMAEFPERVKKLVLTRELNEEGIVAFKIFIKGRPEIVTIDDRLPYGTRSQLFLKGSDDHAYWAPLAEKLYAKVNVNYETIGWGWMSESMQMLTGAPTTLF